MKMGKSLLSLQAKRSRWSRLRMRLVRAAVPSTASLAAVPFQHMRICQPLRPRLRSHGACALVPQNMLRFGQGQSGEEEGGSCSAAGSSMGDRDSSSSNPAQPPLIDDAPEDAEAVEQEPATGAALAI